ncbi:MAG: hypothetical protein WAK20_19960 [Candidatus Acidiferrum sp.]
MTRFREHRGHYDDSMKTVVSCRSLDELERIAKEVLAPFPISSGQFEGIEVKPYGGVDPRNGWDTHIVTLPGYGVLGFTDGPP